MSTVTTSEDLEPRAVGLGATIEAAVAGGILLLALVVRVVYAHDLPMTKDEIEHLEVAREISLRPGQFNLPLDSPISGHPLGVSYVTALADWLSGGSLFGVRLAFISLHLVGLIGLYVLCRTLFGQGAALIALGLAAVDRSLVTLSGVFLESPAVVALAPWTILQMYRCATRGSGPDWILMGLLMGLGHWISTLFLAMLLPFGLYILVTGRAGTVLRSGWMYAGLAVMFAVMLPNVGTELFGGWDNSQRNADKVGAIGLSPRMAILYIGDLLICLKDPTWIVDNIGGKMYLPVYVPCDWVMGLVYIGLGVVSLRFWRDERIALMLAVVIGFLIPVTLIDAREPWNEFTWASSTVIAAVVLAAFVLVRMWAFGAGKVAALLFGAYSLGALAWFLAGPKWGYFTPEWERFYVGQVLATDVRARWDPESFPAAQTLPEVQKLTDDAIRRHPDSAIAWYFRGFFARNPQHRGEAFRQALRLAPNNHLALAELAQALIWEGDLAGAKQLLEPLVARGVRSVQVFGLLAAIELRLGNYARSTGYARELVTLTPEDPDPYRLLFLNHDAMGEMAEAESALKIYLARHRLGVAAAYLSLAEELWQFERPQKARSFLERAIQAEPRRADTHGKIAYLLSTRLRDTDRAIAHFEAAVRLGSTNPVLHYNFGLAVERKREFDRAAQCYQRASQLDPEFAPAHLRLGVVFFDQNRVDEAIVQFERAQRLGMTIPSPYDKLLQARSRTGVRP